MKTAAWMRLLREHRHKKLFSLPDLIQLTDESRRSLLVQLCRLEKQGLIDRVARGWYANPFNPPTPTETATTIRFPSYISLEYALARHSVLSQFPHTITLVTTRAPALHETSHCRFEYNHISRKLFWGYRYEAGVPVAEPEKALLDLIHIRHTRTREFDLAALASLLDDMYVEELDAAKLQEYAGRFGPTTAKALDEALALREQARKTHVRQVRHGYHPHSGAPDALPPHNTGQRLIGRQQPGPELPAYHLQVSPYRGDPGSHRTQLP